MNWTSACFKLMNICYGLYLLNILNPVMGLDFTYPQEMTDAKGAVSTEGCISLEGVPVYYAYWFYVAASQEELSQALETDQESLQGRARVMFYVFSVGENRDFSLVSEATGGFFTNEQAVRIGQAGSWTFYLYMAHDPGFADTVEKEYYDEYTALCGLTDKYAAAFTCYEPFNEYSGESADKPVIRFTATDFDGNEISSEEIFAQHEITMVNIWATWCGPCVGELAELQAIHTRFLEKDCAVVGLMTDRDIESAKSLMKQNGITYQVVLAPKNISSIFPFEGIPTSFFVDRNGAFLDVTITGAYPDQYEPALESLLEQMKNGK